MASNCPKERNTDPEILIDYHGELSMPRVFVEDEERGMRYDECDAGIQFYTPKGNLANRMWRTDLTTNRNHIAVDCNHHPSCTSGPAFCDRLC
jgi:hypothetical protein